MRTSNSSSASWSSPILAWSVGLVSSADSAPVHKVVGAIVAVVVITAAGFAVHRRIEQLIDALEEL